MTRVLKNFLCTKEIKHICCLCPEQFNMKQCFMLHGLRVELVVFYVPLDT